MRLSGAAAHPEVSGAQQLPGKSNYFIGRDPAKWRVNIPNYAQVRYQDVYRGVDLVYYGHQGKLEYDFVIAPGANPGAIQLGFDGMTENNRGPGRTRHQDSIAPAQDGSSADPVPAPATLHITSDGDLIISVDGGELYFRRPAAYQAAANPAGAEKVVVSSKYVITASNRVGFELGPYDHHKPLVIDPELNYSTFMGGSNEEFAMALVTGKLGSIEDRTGSTYFTGMTRSADYPTFMPFQTYHGGTCGGVPCSDIFVTKLNYLGNDLMYSTYIGGSMDEIGNGIAIDGMANVFITGNTDSPDFPVTTGAYETNYAGGSGNCPVDAFTCGDAFVFSLNAASTRLNFSTYLGGSMDEQGKAIAIDSSDNSYITGITTSTNFPTTSGAFKSTCTNASSTCSWVGKLNSTGTVLSYSTYLGGSGPGPDESLAVAVDSTGHAVVTGFTGSPDFPTTAGTYDRTCGTDGNCNGLYDAFVTKFNTTGTALMYSTFLGGSHFDGAYGIALDSSGNAYVVGGTSSSDFPTTSGVVQPAYAGGSSCDTLSFFCGDGFLTKINSTATKVVFSTYMGGSGDEQLADVAMDSGNNLYLVGRTSSTNYPTRAAVQASYGGGASDAVVTKMNARASALTYSTYLGGSSFDRGTSIAVDPSWNSYIIGWTTSANYPITPGVFQPGCGTDGNCNGGLSDVFVSKIANTTDLSVTNSAPGSVTSGSPLTYTIVATNNGPDVEPDTIITDTVPAGTTFSSVSTTAGTCTAPNPGSTGVVTCMLVTPLNKGQRITITLTVNVTAPSGRTITDTASVSSRTRGYPGSYDPNAANNSATANTQVI